MAADPILAGQVRRKKFEMVRRGFDPQEVGAFLEQVASRLADVERDLEEAHETLRSQAGELEDARATEEALQMTMVAATQAKEEMLSRAKTQAEETLAKAQQEAESIVSQARRQALELIEQSRREADDVVTAARDEHSTLLAELDQLRSTVEQVQSLLDGIATTAQLPLERAIEMLDDPTAAHIAETIEFERPKATREDPPSGVEALDDSVTSDIDVESDEVERLLKQLRGS